MSTSIFTDPYASWQKRAIENANGLIRQYVPKTETFEHISHQQITKYSKKINIRPRKKLEFKTPHECFYKQIISEKGLPNSNVIKYFFKWLN